MKHLAWNCRGLGNPRTVRELHLMVKEKSPNVIFLSETKCKRARMEGIRNKLNYDQSFIVDCVGRSGGIAFYWKKEVEAVLNSYSNHHISLTLYPEELDRSILLTGFYGQPIAARRKESWNLIRLIHSNIQCLWLCLGDFNEILLQEEQFGSHARSFNQMEAFRTVVEDCGLQDLGSSGDNFTWSNRREGSDFTKARLDRAFVDKDWRDLKFINSVLVLPAQCSDHNLILVTCSSSYAAKTLRPHIFRYEAAWGKREECSLIVKQAWLLSCHLNPKTRASREGLNNCREKLKTWGRKVSQEHKKIQQAQAEIDKLLEIEEIKWRQRAKQRWLQEGDRNTKYFHQCASHRRLINTIKKVANEKGVTANNQEEVSLAFQDFYRNLFSTSAPRGSATLLQSFQARISSEMNRTLTRPYSKEEIQRAILDMNPLGSLGPDGFPALFYHQHWPAVGKEVTEAVLELLNTRKGFKDINRTFISLIPKKKVPKSVTDFRPISLCNVFYKIIAKVIANRLKVILPSVISPNQSAFVAGRLISNNVVVAYELLHSMKNRLKGRHNGYMALKLDMSKAYDRVKWSFLQIALLKMGFDSSWVDLVMECVTTVSYSILVNGIPQPTFQPARGIRQGDPLSPYLFIICSEMLTHCLNQAESQGAITGIPMARGAMRVTHLFFADDSLVFCKSNPEEWNRMHRTLSSFELASGQRLNLEKTSIFFNSNTKPDTQLSILELAGIKATKAFDKYLGLPSYVGRNKQKAFSSLLDKVKGKMSNWKVNMLSQGGKEILLKSVLQAIPTYSMGIFLLPKVILRRLNQLLQSFWWGRKDNRSKIHWISWKTIGKQKSKGGLGFRDFEQFNLALLAKQGWRLIQDQNSLAAQVLKAKYYPTSSFLSVRKRVSDSYVWKSFLAARHVLEEGLLWRVENGKNIKIWVDKWVPRLSSYMIQSPVSVLDKEASVDQLINPGTMQWNLDLVHSIFSEEEGTMSEDGVGQPSKNNTGSKVWERLWSIKVPNGTKSFLWRAAKESLPTNLNLLKKKVVTSPLCPICLTKEETVSHALWSCKSAQDVWYLGSKQLQKMSSFAESFRELLESMLDKFPSEVLCEMAVTAKLLWHRRNCLVFEDSFSSPAKLSKRIQAEVALIRSEAEQRAIKQPKQDLSPQTWTPPPLGVLKANWDAAVDKTNSRVGLGVVIRDSKGLLVATLWACKAMLPDPILAALRATSLYADLGFTHIVLEGDSLGIVKAVQQT
ncbi:uncharacterized protein LOC122310200 [Carya illinoinensis]|uniref:uncharacterized protein LOC122310200 n=1 Tax=Carya illinoinensis TaxID=32201 RepID=UPI001C718F14|nr:uncharacterized protein LOC122310200 [Carya illinoinensis]